MASWRGADAREIVINGLPILIDTYNLDTYFREKVIHGPGAFIEITTDYRDFAQAFLRKLRREITPITSRNDPTPDGFGRPAKSRFGCLHRRRFRFLVCPPKSMADRNLWGRSK